MRVIATSPHRVPEISRATVRRFLISCFFFTFNWYGISDFLFGSTATLGLGGIVDRVISS